MSEPAVVTPSAPAAQPALVMCDEPGCDNLATVAYTWAWGATGHVCQKHQLLRQQTAKNIRREISFVPIGVQLAPVVENEERIRLNATIISANQERDKAKGRTALLLEQNRALVSETTDLRGQLDRLAAEHRKLGADFDALSESHLELQRVANERADEIVRLATVKDALEAHIADPQNVPLAVPVDRLDTSG